MRAIAWIGYGMRELAVFLMLATAYYAVLGPVALARSLVRKRTRSDRSLASYWIDRRDPHTDATKWSRRPW